MVILCIFPQQITKLWANETKNWYSFTMLLISNGFVTSIMM